LILRDLTAADAADAIALWRACELAVPWNDPKGDFDRAIVTPTSSILGGFVDNEMIATVMLGHDGHRGWMYYLAVSPDHQGVGHGKRLVTASQARMQERNVPKLQLMVRHTNSKVLGFYDRLGYADDNVVVLSKWL
jgi:ribosomal protein S18 acetylase RimI-like enzyme